MYIHPRPSQHLFEKYERHLSSLRGLLLPVEHFPEDIGRQYVVGVAFLRDENGFVQRVSVAGWPDRCGLAATMVKASCTPSSNAIPPVSARTGRTNETVASTKALEGEPSAAMSDDGLQSGRRCEGHGHAEKSAKPRRELVVVAHLVEGSAVAA